MMMSDRMNNAYIRTIFEDTYVVSGMQFMPFKPDTKILSKIANAIGVFIYGPLLCMSVSMFLN
jgi:hypothetical protein